MLDGIVRRHPSLAQDQHLRAHFFQHVENMRAVEDHAAPRRQPFHQFAQHQRRGDVQARKRLVENQQVGIVQQRGREQDLLPHAFRIGR